MFVPLNTGKAGKSVGSRLDGAIGGATVGLYTEDGLCTGRFSSLTSVYRPQRLSA